MNPHAAWQLRDSHSRPTALYWAMTFGFLLLGAYMVLRPRAVARFRNRGAVDPEPTQGRVVTTRYVGGPLSITLGVVMAYILIWG